VFYPPRIDETGSDVGMGQQVATGTNELGVDQSGGDCFNYTDPTYPIHWGLADSGPGLWTNAGVNSDCTTSMRLYCFGVDHLTALPALPVTGKRMFVSKPTMLNVGLSTLDAACNSEATIAGLTGTFVALLATTTQDALTHAGGLQANPWVRLDGVEVTKDFMQFSAPPALGTGDSYLNIDVATGAMASNTLATAGSGNCTNWSGSGTYTDYGQSTHSWAKAFNAGNMMNCGSAQAVYCVEK
jgi:hypothetical protein